MRRNALTMIAGLLLAGHARASEIAWSPVLASAPDDRARSETCLAQAISYEAGGEPETGKEAVAQVVLNRLRDPAYPKSICGVVFQGSERRTGCQFTFTCDGSLARRRPADWADALRIARLALDGLMVSPVGEATHYHAFYVNPAWAAQLTRVGRIGAHIFYAGPIRGAARSNVGAAPLLARPHATRFSVWGLETAVLTAGAGGTAVIAPGGAIPSRAPRTDDRSFP